MLFLHIRICAIITYMGLRDRSVQRRRTRPPDKKTWPAESFLERSRLEQAVIPTHKPNPYP